jgi:hypothetical protein
VIMSEFDIDIEAPFPSPDKETLSKKPEPLGYRSSEIRYKHYGRNVELLISKAVAIEDAEEKEAAIIYLGRLMKGFQTVWNRDNIDDFTIIKDIESLSKKQLTIDLKKVQEQNLFEPLMKDRKTRPKSNQQQGGKNRRNNNNRRRRNN